MSCEVILLASSGARKLHR